MNALPTPDWLQSLQEAERLAAAGDFGRAMPLATQAARDAGLWLEARTDDATAHAAIAELHRRIGTQEGLSDNRGGNCAAAIATLQRALPQWPQHTQLESVFLRTVADACAVAGTIRSDLIAALADADLEVAGGRKRPLLLGGLITDQNCVLLWCRLLHEVGRHRLRSGRYKTAVTVLDQAQSELHTGPGRNITAPTLLHLHALLRLDKSRALLRLGDHKEAYAEFGRARDLYLGYYDDESPEGKLASALCWVMGGIFYAHAGTAEFLKEAAGCLAEASILADTLRGMAVDDAALADIDGEVAALIALLDSADVPGGPSSLMRESLPLNDEALLPPGHTTDPAAPADSTWMAILIQAEALGQRAPDDALALLNVAAVKAKEWFMEDPQDSFRAARYADFRWRSEACLVGRENYVRHLTSTLLNHLTAKRQDFRSMVRSWTALGAITAGLDLPAEIRAHFLRRLAARLEGEQAALNALERALIAVPMPWEDGIWADLLLALGRRQLRSHLADSALRYFSMALSAVDHFADSRNRNERLSARLGIARARVSRQEYQLALEVLTDAGPDIAGGERDLPLLYRKCQACAILCQIRAGLGEREGAAGAEAMLQKAEALAAELAPRADGHPDADGDDLAADLDLARRMLRGDQPAPPP